MAHQKIIDSVKKQGYLTFIPEYTRASERGDGQWQNVTVVGAKC